ncbi:MAG: N-acetyltransferase family protein [Desulfobacterales bacterium]
MNTDHIIRAFEEKDGRAVIDIFNHYIENSFAAYAEKPVVYETISIFKDMTRGYPFLVIETADRFVAGFSFLRPFHRNGVFSRTAEITYFIRPEYTRKGYGKKLLNRMEKEAKRLFIDSILASISSLNPPSIAFHRKNGFFQCGCFKSVGKKFNRDFDMIWMQKMI